MALIAVLIKSAATNPSGHRQEIVVLLERCASEFRDQHYQGQKIGSFIDELLFQKKYLEIGCRTPDIEGADHEGKQFSLKEHAGKVTVLDFLGRLVPTLPHHVSARTGDGRAIQGPAVCVVRRQCR